MMTQDQAHQAIDQLADSAHDLVDRILSGAMQGQEMDNAVLENLSGHPEQLFDLLTGYIQEHPLAAAGAALAAGYMVSRVL